MNRRAGERGGFTLLEILIAIGLMAIGMVTIFTLFPIGILAVKDTVEGTRGVQIARSARSELEARRADLAIVRSGSRTYHDQYFPAGPWHYPSSLRAFDDCVYSYVQTGALHNRVVFDDRTMLPIRLGGVFTGGDSVTVARPTITRESDWLKHFYDFAGNTFAPWDILLRVQGGVWRLTGMTLAGASLSDDILALTVDVSGGVNLPAAGVPQDPEPFQVLLPVAAREAPVEAPQGWSGAYADFSAGGPSYPVIAGTATRNTVDYLVDGSWISVGGDWFRVSNVVTASGVPTQFTLAGPQPAASLALPADPAEQARVGFDVLVPCADFGAVTGDMQRLALPAGVPEAAYLVEGAEIEIVLDGAWGSMNGVLVTLDGATVNADTSTFLTAGNYVRIDGRDYEIATDLAGGAFTVLGTLPYAASKYFNIVIGYDPAVASQAPRVARFPVLQILPPDASGLPIDVGEDDNDNLPEDLGLAVGGVILPIHILPRNVSQYAWQASLGRKSLEGAFDNGAHTINAPSQTVADAQSPTLAGVPYPINSEDVEATQTAGLDEAFNVYVLTSPLQAGTHNISNLLGLDADELIIQRTSTIDLLVDGETAPFVCVDRNYFVPDSSLMTDLYVGDAVFTNPGPAQIDFSASAATLTDFANFIESGVWLDLNDLVSGAAGTAKVDAFDRATLIATLSNVAGGLVGGETVKVSFLSAGTGTANFPLGRGLFANGASIAVSVYGAPYASPFNGFPYATSISRRFHLEPGDYIQPLDGTASPPWYAVKAIVKSDGVRPDYVVLDRPFAGNSSGVGGWAFKYETPVSNIFRMQAAVFRNFRTRPLYDDAVALTRSGAAQFGYDDDGDNAYSTDELQLVRLALALPPDIKPGDYIRADGDADHNVSSGGGPDTGLGDAVDGDGCWYMIDMIDASRTLIQLASPYRGYVPPPSSAGYPAYQPASVSPAVVHTYDTLMGAF